MTLPMLLASADALAEPIAACAGAARACRSGRDLRAEIGAIGRAGERRMLRRDRRGEHPPRRAVGARPARGGPGRRPAPSHGAARFAAAWPRIDDPAATGRAPRRTARGPGCATARPARWVRPARGFPHTVRRRAAGAARARGRPGEHAARRRAPGVDGQPRGHLPAAPRRTGGPAGRARRGGRGPAPPADRARAAGAAALDRLDRLCRRRRLSPGGSGDVLAAALFVDSVDALPAAEGNRCHATLHLPFPALSAAARARPRRRRRLRRSRGPLRADPRRRHQAPTHRDRSGPHERRRASTRSGRPRSNGSSPAPRSPGRWELNDAGATPALVTLRLQQAAERRGRTAEGGRLMTAATDAASSARRRARSVRPSAGGPLDWQRVLAPPQLPRARRPRPRRGAARRRHGPRAVRAVRAARIAVAGAAGRHARSPTTVSSSPAAPIDGDPVVVVSIEQEFQGGGIGEVSGAKITQALRLAAAEQPRPHPVPAVLLLETGGVRLQEANLGLNAVAEICSALLELRPLAPVIGVVAGSVGSFGGREHRHRPVHARDRHPRRHGSGSTVPPSSSRRPASRSSTPPTAP